MKLKIFRRSGWNLRILLLFMAIILCFIHTHKISIYKSNETNEADKKKLWSIIWYIALKRNQIIWTERKERNKKKKKIIKLKIISRNSREHGIPKVTDYSLYEYELCCVVLCYVIYQTKTTSWLGLFFFFLLNFISRSLLVY